jgi:EAL domain-containing protein (putative c-di-GMP-specific phosphodiesterase class I)/DNA-binding NarL/FixJ family response regulator
VTDRTLVLVVDDDRASRSLVKHALEGEGFDTVLASNGQEALDRIAELAIDIVLMDVSMPVLGGLEALRRIRADDHSRRLPVILVTGSAGEADRVRGLETGADDYLAKPIGLRELAARVRSQLRSRTAWTHELERGRAVRRKLASVVENLRTDVPLLALATTLADQLPAALDLDGVAVLHIGHDVVRTIAASGALQWRFQPSRELPALVGAEIASRAASGAWLEAGEIRSGRRVRTIDIAFVPYKLGSSPEPLGCLAYGLQPGGLAGPLSHRLPDLIDATDFIVAVLRPAVEEAETAGTAIDRIRRIVSDHEFTTLLQPIFRLDGRTIIAVEALTRFASGLPPDTQFAEAAAFGLGRTLERAAAAAALAAVASLPKHVALSVNLSADVLQNEPTLPALFATTERAIIVELTEHERIDDYPAVRSALGRLGSNVKLAIDDAGSGFASLRHIFALEPAYVKLDIEWVRGIERDPVRRALVSGLVYFASETGCELIAEGIETDAEVGALRDLGIQLGQGYLLGLPEPVDA